MQNKKKRNKKPGFECRKAAYVYDILQSRKHCCMISAMAHVKFYAFRTNWSTEVLGCYTKIIQKKSYLVP